MEIASTTASGIWRTSQWRRLTLFSTCITGKYYIVGKSCADASHFSNIDRQLAIWQTLNESAWFEDSDEPKSSDELPPFHHKTKTGQIAIYTSDAVRDWTSLGYQYDVLERKAGENNDAYIARIKAYLDSYQNTGQFLMRAPENLLGPEKVKDNIYPDYLIDVLYDR